MSQDNTASRHILMLVYGSVRDDPRVMNEGKSLVQAGYHVTVIGAPREGYDPEPSRTEIDGLDVILVPLLDSVRLPGMTRMALRLLRGDIGTQTKPIPQRRDALRTFINILVFWLWSLRLSWSERYDLIHAHDVIPLPVAWLLGARYAAPFIYDSHEPWRYVYARESGFKNQVFAWMDRVFMKRVAALIVVWEPKRSEAEAADAQRIVRVGNFKRLSEYETVEAQMKHVRDELNIDHYELVVSYIGFLYPHRGVEELVKAVARMPEIALIVAGRGDSQTVIEQVAQSAPNVYWVGWLRLAEVPVYTKASDVVFCWFPDEPGNYFMSPNKFSEALVSGRVLLAHRGVGEMGDVLEREAAGYLIDDLSEESLIEALNALKDQALRERLSKNAYALRHHYSWARAEANLHNLYRDLIGDPHPST